MRVDLVQATTRKYALHIKNVDEGTYIFRECGKPIAKALKGSTKEQADILILDNRELHVPRMLLCRGADS